MLRAEILGCERLGETEDQKQIYFYRCQPDSAIMREIGRLREMTFRTVGEGTGARRDIDRNDVDYFHLIPWDEDEQEIAGACRLCDARPSAGSLGRGHLYSSALFNFSPAMGPYLERGLELGRSFVQPKYWGRRSLDYLWFGIGAFLRRRPEFRYLFGPVSINNKYPPQGMEMLVPFYSTHFSPGRRWPRHNCPT